jgi:predicted enzyme related to lactoylglutathione lyase
LVFEVDDIEAVVASMRRTGINVRNDIICGPGGTWILAEDPSATRLKLNLAGERT